MVMIETRGQSNVCSPEAVKYRFSKKWNCWVRTWFTVEAEKNENFFKQRISFSKDRNRDWDKWATSPERA
jgi:hypothetical protein